MNEDRPLSTEKVKCLFCNERPAHFGHLGCLQCEEELKHGTPQFVRPPKTKEHVILEPKENFKNDEEDGAEQAREALDFPEEIREDDEGNLEAWVSLP